MACVGEDIDGYGDLGWGSKKDPSGGLSVVTMSPQRVVGETSAGHAKALDEESNTRQLEGASSYRLLKKREDVGWTLGQMD